MLRWRPRTTPERKLHTSSTIHDVGCTVCGCVCDELSVTVEQGRVTAFSPGCPLAEPWLLDQTTADLPPAYLGGHPVTVDDAVEQAANILRAARAPLIYGLSRSSTPGQRAACRLDAESVLSPATRYLRQI